MPGAKSPGPGLWAQRPRLKYILFVLILIPPVFLFMVYFTSEEWVKPSPSTVHLLGPRRTADGRLLEIRLESRAFIGEGIGASLSGLKPVLLIANATGAAITATGEPNSGHHGYKLRKFISLGQPIRSPRRRFCKIDSQRLIWAVNDACERFDYTAVRKMFKSCEIIRVKKYLNHPRSCVAQTAPLVRGIFRHRLLENPIRNNLCVLRRGGDVEERIEKGEGNHWGIDTKLTLPILAVGRQYLMEIVVITETYTPLKLRMQYGHPLTLSNKEPLQRVHERLSHCRCLFGSSGSSFAAAMVQLSNPPTFIYTVNHKGYEFKVKPYNFSDYGNQAIPITTPRHEIIRRCVNRRTNWWGIFNFFTW